MKPTTRLTQIGGLARLGGGALSLGAALLAVLPAPTTLLWMLAVAVTEWGHLLAALALLPLLPGWRRTRAGRIGGACGLAATLLALTPLLRAQLVARQLPAQLAASFGEATPRAGADAPPRPAPLVARDLLGGVDTPDIAPERRVYATREGLPLLIELYRPPAPRGPAPGVVMIHGGSWQGGGPGDLDPLNRYLAARGYLVAAISYRLAPRHPFPAAADDVRAALGYLRANSQELGLDPARLVLVGRSAGGHLALLAAYQAEQPVRGVVAFYAPTDLRYGYEHPSNPWVLDSRGTLRAFLAGTPDTAPAAYDAASPLRFVGPATPPTLLVHGARDELVQVAHSERLLARLRAAARPAALLRLPWATHGCDYNFSGPSGQLSTYAVEHFLAAVTSDQQPVTSEEIAMARRRSPRATAPTRRHDTAPETNPALGAAILDIVDKQLREHNPPETHATLQRLVGLGYTPEGARQLIAHAVIAEIVGLMQSGQPADPDRYIAALRRLPAIEE